MHIVELDLNHENFYCPVTGHWIVGEEKEFSASPAMVGLWHDHCYYEPEIYEDWLEVLWDEHLKKVEEDDEDLDVTAFLQGVPNDTCVCFVITTYGMACGPMSFTRWFVFDMDAGSRGEFEGLQ